MAKIALAPYSDLSSVPSDFIKISSINCCSIGFLPIIEGPKTLLIFCTALRTPLPRYSFSASLNSNASLDPVDAPLGTIARPSVPSSKIILHEIVGMPLESKT